MAHVHTPDFTEYKKALSEFIKSQPGFGDYNFDASALNILTDILAYNTQQLNYAVNMSYSEMFMDSSFLRETVISHAQLVGYFPNSIKSAEAKVSLTLTGTPNTTHILPKDFEFGAKGISDQNLRFVSKESQTFTLNSSGQKTIEIVLVEGVRKLYRFPIVVDKTKYIIPVPNMDLSTLIVKVYPSINSGSFDLYDQYDNLFELDPESKIYWIYETLNNSYQIQFGDGILGNKLSPGNVVSVEYILSSGLNGNGSKNFSASDSLPGISNISVTTITPGVGGANKESIETIKSRAPLNYAIQNRAVTANDYKTLIKKYFPDISAISVWGGENNPIPSYGKVFVSIKPETKDRLTDLEISNIKIFLSKKQVVTNSIEFVHPEIIDIHLNTSVKLKNNSLSQGAVESAIKVAVNTFANNELNDFNSQLKYSRLIETIDSATDTIDFNLTDISLRYKIYPQFNVERAYTFSFENRIIPGSVQTRILFQNRDSLVKDDMNGSIAIYRPVNNVLVKITEIGSINYQTGVVILNKFAPQFTGSAYIIFAATPNRYSITAKNNKLLQIPIENIEVYFNL